MRTLIELYDERPIENVLSTQVFAPEKTVFICPKETADSPQARRAITEYLRRKEIGTRVEFVAGDMFSTDDMLKQLEKIVNGFPDCVLDITGGTDQALFAAGVMAARSNVPVFTYSRRANTFFSVSNAPFGDRLPCETVLRVDDCFVMAGGSVRKGRVDNAILKRYLSFFEPFFDVYQRYRHDWAAFVKWMQRVSAPRGGISMDVRADLADGISCAEILKALSLMGFVKKLKIAGSSVEFSFRDAQVRTWLRDVGGVLETYVYKLCLDSGIFHDVATSVVVDWEGDNRRGNVTNEIDVMATRALVPLFISCKTCDIKTEALNELALLRDRFGGKMAKAALVTAAKSQAITRLRAKELGIEIIDAQDLRKDRLLRRLRLLMQTER